MPTLQEYIGKVKKILIFCFPFFVLFCIFFVSHMPVPTELKNPPPKMEKPPIYDVEQIEHFRSKEIFPRSIQDIKEDIKIIYYIGYKQLEGMSSFSECEFSKCIITGNEEFILRKHRNGITKFDAVAINIESYKENKRAQKISKIIQNRGSKQIFIMKMRESPRPDITTPMVNKIYFSDHIFNWTWSYRANSDVLDPYGYGFYPKGKKPPSSNWKPKSVEKFDMKKLPKHLMAFWLVSHCTTVINREGYVEKLKEYINITQYGRCSGEECSRKNGNECFEELAQTHMFYIAFENSICEDYATEKFYRSLFNPVVPIVMGGANYKEMAPPHSYIDVNDFKSIKDLADYLIRLSKNKNEYNAYFKWKNTHDVYRLNTFCELCQKLHDPTIPKKIVANSYDWWYKKSSGENACTNGSERSYFKDFN